MKSKFYSKCQTFTDHNVIMLTLNDKKLKMKIMNRSQVSTHTICISIIEEPLQNKQRDIFIATWCAENVQHTEKEAANGE